MNGDEQFRRDVETRLRALEDAMRQNSSVGVAYSRLQSQLTELSLQVEALIQSLRKLVPEFETNFEEFCNELRTKRDTNDENEYFR